MGKSSKKSAPKVDAAPAVISPAKLAKKEVKRQAEDEIEKQVIAKKQKKNEALELAVQKQKVEVKVQKKKKVESSSSSEEESESEEEKVVQKKTVVQAKVQKKEEISSSSEDESDSDEEKAPVAKVVSPVAVNNGSVVAPTKKNKAASSSEEDSTDEDAEEDENAASKNTAVVSKMKTDSGDKSDVSDSDEDESDSDEDKVQSAKTTATKASIEPKTPATPQGESKSNTLFVGNLSFNVEKTDIENFFKDAGAVVDIRFASDHDGRFKGYGHVEFETPEAAQKALALNGELLLNREVRLDLARERGAYTPHDNGDRSSFQKGGRSQTVYVRGFDRSLGEDEARNLLQEHFGACGEISRMSLPKDFETGSTKGFAYIDFKDGNSFNQALELNGSELGDGYLTVEEAKPRGEGDSGRGRGRGGRGDHRGRGDRGRGRGRFGDSGGRFSGRGNSGRGRGRGGGFNKSSFTSSGKKTTFNDE